MAVKGAEHSAASLSAECCGGVGFRSAPGYEANWFVVIIPYVVQLIVET